MIPGCSNFKSHQEGGGGVGVGFIFVRLAGGGSLQLFRKCQANDSELLYVRLGPKPGPKPQPWVHWHRGPPPRSLYRVLCCWAPSTHDAVIMSSPAVPAAPSASVGQQVGSPFSEEQQRDLHSPTPAAVVCPAARLHSSGGIILVAITYSVAFTAVHKSTYKSTPMMQ